MVSDKKKTADYWESNLDNRKNKGPEITHWWDHPLAVRLYRDMYRQSDADEGTRASHLLLKDVSDSRTYKSAVSFACGIGWKEIELIKRRMVDHFTLVELSPVLCNEAKLLARANGISDRVSIVCSSFEDFDSQGRQFDLVYWDAALHHMSDTEKAIQFSIDALRDGGVFFADDYVGPSYNQYGAEMYDLGDHIRSLLPRAWFSGDSAIPKTLGRYGIEDVLATDPTEAADSSSILPSAARLMPGAKIYPMGGITYMVACREAFGKFTAGCEKSDSIMRLMFELERNYRASNPEYTLQAMITWTKGQKGKTQDNWQQCICDANIE